MWNIPGPGLELVPPALAGGLFTTRPAGNSSVPIEVSATDSWLAQTPLSHLPSPPSTFMVVTHTSPSSLSLSPDLQTWLSCSLPDTSLWCSLTLSTRLLFCPCRHLKREPLSPSPTDQRHTHFGSLLPFTTNSRVQSHTFPHKLYNHIAWSGGAEARNKKRQVRRRNNDHQEGST